MARAKQDIINEPDAFSVLPLLVHGDAAFAGQGVVAETLNLLDHQGLPGGRHHPPDHQQPAGLHHPARRSPLLGVLHRHRQDGPGADLPRERRRPRGLRAGRPPGLRLPPAVPQGRRHRHGVLPPPRPQRGRRPQLHPAAHVQAHRRPPVGPQALHRVPGQARRHQHRGGRAGPRRLPEPAADGAGRDPLAGPRRRRAGPAAGAGGRRAAPRRDGGRTGRPRPVVPPAVHARPTASPSIPSCPSSSTHATRCSTAARSTGPWPSCWPSGPCCCEGTNIRLAGQDTRRGTFSHRHSVWVDYETGREYVAAGPPRARTRPRSGSTTRCCRSTPRSASSTATRSSAKDTLVIWEAQFGDFVNGATDHPRPVHRGRRGQVGPDLGPGPAAAPRLRGPGTRALLGPHRALPHAVRRGQHAGLQRHHRGPVLPPAAPPDGPPGAQAADRVHAQVRCCGPRPPARRSSALHRGSFEEVLDDARFGPGGPGDAEEVQRVVLCSGKVSHDAIAARDERDFPAAVVRVEQLYPWPEGRVTEVLERYSNATEVVWLQEEPDNMGPRVFVQRAPLARWCPTASSYREVSRVGSGSPGHRQPHHPRPGAGGPPGPDLPRTLTCAPPAC